MTGADAIAARKAAALARVEARISDAVREAPPLPVALERRLRELVILAQDHRREQKSLTEPPALALRSTWRTRGEAV
jgi:hypothetical protein